MDEHTRSCLIPLNSTILVLSEGWHRVSEAGFEIPSGHSLGVVVSPNRLTRPGDFNPVLRSDLQHVMQLVSATDAAGDDGLVLLDRLTDGRKEPILANLP